MRTATPGGKNAPRSNPPAIAHDRELTCARFAATQTLKRLAGLWKTPVLLVLLEGPRRFAEIERELAPLSARVLTQRLRELERDGFVRRTVLVDEPPKVVEYGLTARGEALRPVFAALAEWQRGARAEALPRPHVAPSA